MIIDNKSDGDIRKFMTDRYGDFVVFKPPINKTTYVLWITPFAFLIIAIALLLRSLKNRQKNAAESQIDTSRAEELLKK